jgi:hypothetical protein
MIFYNRTTQEFEFQLASQNRVSSMGYTYIENSDKVEIDKFYQSYPTQLNLPEDFSGTILSEHTFGEDSIVYVIQENSDENSDIDIYTTGDCEPMLQDTIKGLSNAFLHAKNTYI